MGGGQEGVPSAFKRANGAPILKDAKGDTKAPTNYRGISLTPILPIVITQLEDQFSMQCTTALSDTQYGCRRNRSAMLLLAQAVVDWLITKDAGKLQLWYTLTSVRPSTKYVTSPYFLSCTQQELVA